ncbi:MAG: universal stress protein [Candidatus Hydrothermarchaeota archaeon]|nr:universal stress protein [Candidatus Hydrothermarchaeota archaeon]
MFKKILYPTDFSEYARATLECAGELKSIGAEEVVLLHVIDEKSVIGISGSAAPDLLVAELQKEVEKKLEELKIMVEKQGMEARIVKPVPLGSPADEIIKIAGKEDASLILIGARGKGLIREAFLGSVSHKVVRGATKPVIVTKLKVAQKLGKTYCELLFKPMFRKILYSTDFSECAERALEYVKRVKEAGAEEVVALHVVEKGETKEEIERNKKEAEKHLEGLADELKKLGFKVKALVEVGIPSKEILKVANEEKATIIMMGSRGLGFVRGMLIGSTSDKVVREAEVPVFLCKREISL